MDSAEKKTFSIVDTFGKSTFDADIAKAQSIDSLMVENNESPSSLPWYVWLLVVLIVAFLLFFIYLYFSKGSFSVTSFFDSAKESVNNFFAKIGLKKEIPVVIIPNTDTSQNVGSTEGEKIQKTEKKDQINDAAERSSLYKSLNSAEQEKPKHGDYKEDISRSTIQQTKTGKSGWCFIGEDRGFRSCAKVNDNDTCMSGNIFPSQDICINPNLRV